MYQIVEIGRNIPIKYITNWFIKRLLRTKIILKVRKISQFKIYKLIFNSLKKANKKNIDVHVCKTLI